MNNNININEVDLNLLYAKKYDDTDDFHFIVHTHPFMEIFYIIEGKCDFVLENKTISVEKHDLIILNSNVKHTEKIKEKSNLTYIAIGIEGLSINPEITNIYYEDDIDTNYSIIDDFFKYNFFMQNFENTHKEMEFLINLLVQEQEDKNIYYDEVSKNILKTLILHIFRHSNTNLTISTNSKSNNLIKQIKLFLDTHYSREISIDTLANMIYINKFYLIKKFKKLYGKSPIQYLVDKRIEISKNLLQSTDHTIKDIALIVGFNSQSYFNKLFFEKVNMTPKQYRKNFSQN